MFGDRNVSDLIEKALEDLSFEEILEMNDLSEIEVLSVLFEQGFLLYPEMYFPQENESDYEDYEED